MGIYEELVARGLIAQVTDDSLGWKKLKEGFDCCSLFSYWLYFCLCPYYF